MRLLFGYLLATISALNALKLPTHLFRANAWTATTLAPRMLEDPEFNDFERECFGDGEECEVWYFGETPKDVEKRLTQDARPESAM